MTDDFIENAEEIPLDVLKEHLELTERLKQLKDVEKAQTGFLPFVKSQWPSFIGNLILSAPSAIAF